MKLKKMLLLPLVILLITGCMKTELDIEVKNNGSGVINYEILYTEDYIDKAQLFSEKHGEDYEVEEITETIGEVKYVGERVRITFKSISDFNDKMKLINEDESQALKMEETDKLINVSLPADKDTLQSIKEMNDDKEVNVDDIFKYKISFKFEGKVKETNGEKISDKEVVYDSFTTIMSDGIEIEVSKNMFDSMFLVKIGLLTFSVVGFIGVRFFLGKKQ